MPLVRRGGKLYYYKTSRRGGRYRCEYRGSGVTAELLAAVDRGSAAHAAAVRQARQAWERSWAGALAVEDRAVSDYFHAVEASAVAALTAAGYRRRNYGPWRKQRGGTPMTEAETTRAAVPATRPGLSDAEILARAQRGDREVIPALRELISRREYAHLDSDPSEVLENIIFGRVDGGNLAVTEVMRRDLRRRAVEFAGPNPSPLVRALAVRAALCEIDSTTLAIRSQAEKGLSIKQAEYLGRVADRAHRRFLSACRTLAAVQRMRGPSVQINVGNNQVNIAGGEPPARPRRSARPRREHGQKTAS